MAPAVHPHRGGGGEDHSIGGTINAVLGGIQGLLDTKVINAVQYVL